MRRTLKAITGHSRIDGIVPGVRGQRAFPLRELRTVDPFVMLDHIGPQEVGEDYFMDGRNSGHPHRGFETMTLMFEGNMNHRDSLGNKVKLNSGSVQRMNAGRGIQHGGDFMGDPKKHTFHEVQLWINLPSKLKMSEPGIHNVQHESFPILQQNQAEIKVISGTINGAKGPIKTMQPTKIAHVVCKAEQPIKLKELSSNYNLVVYALKGEFEVEGKRVSPQHSMIFNNDGDAIEIKSLGKGELLVAAGLPINEPVVMGGPFVMNTTEEIEQAYDDFNAGKFGEISY